jgi:hypothetical protein
MARTPAAVAALAKEASDAAPRLLPLILVLSALLWVFTMTGGRQIFVKEVLGGAYDSQAEHFLRGNVDVDGADIGHEAMIVNGKARMYFGPFPAFVRMPLNFVYPSGRGYWSRISGFCAGIIAIVAFAGLIGMGLRASQLSPRWRNWVGNACLVGFAFGSPLLLLLGNLSIYDEAIIWGLAWSLAALFFAFRSRETEGGALTRSLLGFSLCAAFALLSRVTFGAPFILIAPFLVLPIRRENRIVNFAALFLPLGAGLSFYVLLNYAKFGSFTGATYDFYINPVHREFARQHGIFNLIRVPYSFVDYFSLVPPPLHFQPPFLRVGRHVLSDSAPFSLPLSEIFLSIPWCSSWLVVGATMGIICLIRAGRADYFQRWVAVALFAQFVCMLSYFALAQRYAADLYPFLIFCLVVFLSSGGVALLRSRHIIVGLVALSVVINCLATISWLIDADHNVPGKTRAAWKMLLGRH